MVKKIPESLLKKWTKEEIEGGKTYRKYGLETMANEEFSHAEKHQLRIQLQKNHPEMFE
jgi:hypothetical protein